MDVSTIPGWRLKKWVRRDFLPVWRRHGAVILAFLTFYIADTEAIEYIVDSNDSFVDAIHNISFGDIVTIMGGSYLRCNQEIRASNITIRALPNMKVVIDCNRSSSHFIIIGESVRVQGITFMNGFSLELGGCVKIFGKGAMLQDCRFERCDSRYGGGIYLASAADAVTVINLHVVGCKAVFGGGLFANSSVRLLMLGRINFQGNTASESGGGLYLASGSVTAMDVQTSGINDNRANVVGGGIYLASARISISGDINFVNNSAVSAGGGLALMWSLATFESGSTISFRHNSFCLIGCAVSLISNSLLYSVGYISFEGMLVTGPSHC
jgi:predicted outer membrane repeat protein